MELMLVIDSEKLSQQIHETESDYMKKSKEVLANGQETEGAKYQGKVLNRKRSYITVCLGLSFPQPARPALRELQSLYEKIKLIQTTGGNAVSVSIRAS